MCHVVRRESQIDVNRRFPTRMVYLKHDIVWRYTILVGNPRNDIVLSWIPWGNVPCCKHLKRKIPLWAAMRGCVTLQAGSGERRTQNHAFVGSHGGWILDNFPKESKIWEACVETRFMPDDVLLLNDNSEDGAEPARRYYLANRADIDTRRVARLRREEEERRWC